MSATSMSGGRGLRPGRAPALGLAVVFIGGGVCLADQSALWEPDADDTNNTVITSTRLNYDQERRTAIFEDQVVVTDPRVKITAEKMTVFFSGDNKVLAIEAEGSVVIRQDEKIATGEKARYDVDEGKFVLTGRPKIQNGRDLLSADVITFWRNTNRIQCEPHARLEIRTEHVGMTNSVLKRE